MTDIEQKALELVNEVQAEEGYVIPSLRFKRGNDPFSEALCRAIEQHEAFRQEVSDAVELFHKRNPFYSDILAHFIVAKPDLLVEAIQEMMRSPANEMDAHNLRKALAARGGKIVWGEG